MTLTVEERAEVEELRQRLDQAEQALELALQCLAEMTDSTQAASGIAAGHLAFVERVRARRSSAGPSRRA